MLPVTWNAMSTGWLPRKPSEARSSHPTILDAWWFPQITVIESSSRTEKTVPQISCNIYMFANFPCCLGNFEVNITYHPSIQSLHRLSVRVEYTDLDLYDLYMTTLHGVVVLTTTSQNNFVHRVVVVVPSHKQLISRHLHEIISKNSYHHLKWLDEFDWQVVR